MQPSAGSLPDSGTPEFAGGRRLGDVQGMAAEEALRASEGRFRGILEGAPTGIVLADGEGLVAYANERAARLFGYLVAELIGMRLDELVPEALAAAPRESETSAGEADIGPAVTERKLEAQRSDGSRVSVEIGVSSFEAQGTRYTIAILHDVSARKEVEARLRSTTENLEALVAASPLATMILDLEGRVCLWNPAAEKLFGWRSDEVLGEILPHVPEPLVPEVREIQSRVSNGEVISGMELHRVHKDGSSIEVELFAAAQRDPAGNVIGMIEQMADVTSRREMEETLLQAQKMESIGRLAGGIAHDFNNMLTAISGFAQLLMFDLPEGSDQHENAAAIKRAAGQAASLTQQPLAFSRRQVLQPKVLAPDDVILEIEPMIRRLIGENIELRTHISSAGAHMRADPAQLEQVIVNLALNARDAMPEGGTLTIETGTATFDEAYSREHFGVSPGRHVMIAVSDTGVGMDSATRIHAFEPFFTTKENGKGTGLGLATIYGVVRQSGGRIWLYSEPGHGTTFKVYFPAVEEAAERVEEVSSSDAGGTETILLVEDEEGVRNLARIVLERQGYNVKTARNAEEALAVVADPEQRVDLLATDVVMPGMGGPELARRAKELRPGVRALFLSGYTEEVVGKSGRLEGSEGFLSKPFTPQALARKVREVLRADPESNRDERA